MLTPGPQGYGETVARELFPDVSRRELAAKRGVFGPHLAYQDSWLGNQRRGLAEYFVSLYPKPIQLPPRKDTACGHW
jgi:hypothetical protein